MQGFDREKFDAVWRRVTLCKTAPGASEDTEAGILRGLMDTVALGTCYCRAVAEKYPGRVSFCRVVRDNLRISKRLRALYFIETGDTYHPDVVCEPFQTVSEGLRAVYSVTVNAAVSLSDAVEATRRSDFVGTYHETAELKYQHAATVGRMIEDLVR